MRFLLNSEIKIFKILLEEKDGGFMKIEKNLGNFYASVRMTAKTEAEFLSVTIRKNPDLDGELKIFYNDRYFVVTSILSSASGYLKLLCERRKI